MTENKGVEEVTDNPHSKEAAIEVYDIIDGLKNGVIILEKEFRRNQETLQSKQEELEAQAEELEIQNEELRENYNALQKSEEINSRLASIVESSDDAIISKTLGGVIISWNAGAERMFGYTAGEVIGKNVSILNPPGHYDEIPGILNRIRNGERVEHFETVRMRKDRKLIDISITVSPIKDKSGAIVGASSIKRDITEQKQMEKELQDKQEELEIQTEELELQNEEIRTNNLELHDTKMQSELYLDLMGHDISNMHQIAISQLELAAEIMDETGRLEKDNKELIDTSLKTLQRSARLIEDVRNIQNVKAGDYQLETIDLRKMLKDVVRANSGISNRKVTINYTPVDCCFVKATPLLKDVLDNLVDNAIKHNKGSPVITIKVHQINDNGHQLYRVAVEDNGVGVPDPLKGEIFNRLKRGKTIARGTGLGLFIVKTLVESYKGKVSVEDRVPGDHTKGSRFIIYLPVAEENGE